MFSDARVWAGLILSLVGTIFLMVGVALYFSGYDQNQATDQLETLPLLNTTQLSDTPPGTEAVIEGQIAEPNPLYVNSFVVYISYQYQGERCTEDDEGSEDCEDIWVEQERVTPDLWLDLDGGRTHLVNTDYTIKNAPVIWQSPDSLIEYKTFKYYGFQIGNPVFARGIVAPHTEEPTFEATFIYGSNRATYLVDQRESANVSFQIGIVFSVLGGLLVLVAGGLFRHYWK